MPEPGQPVMEMPIFTPEGVPFKWEVIGITVPNPDDKLHPGLIQIAITFMHGQTIYLPFPYEAAKQLKDVLENNVRQIGTGLTVATEADIIALHNENGHKNVRGSH